MSEPLIIQIQGDNTPWRRALAQSKQLGRSLADDMIIQNKRVSAEIVKQARLAGDAQIRESKRSTREVIKDFNDVVRAAGKGTMDTAKSHARAVNEIVRGSKRQRDELKKDIAEVSATDEREARRSEARANRLTIAKDREAGKTSDAQLKALKKVLTHEEVTEAAKLRLIQRTNRERITAAEKQIQATGRLVEWHGTLTKVTQATGGSASAAGIAGAVAMARYATGVGGAIAALQLAKAAARELSEATNDAAENARRLAGGVADKREQQRELATTLGVKNDDAFVIENAQFGKDTAQRPDEVIPFRTALAGSGIQFRGKNIGAAEYAEYEKKLATIGAARGLDAQTAGDFGGGVLGLQDFTKHGANADEVAAATANRQLGILAEGRGDMPTLARQIAKVNAANVNEDELRGSIRSPEEAATLTSVAAEFSPADASETVRASLRAVQKYDDKEAGPYLKKAGIKSGMSPIEKFKRLAPVVEAEAKASGQNVNEVLRSKMGFSELEVQGVGTMLNRGVAGGLFQKRQDIADKLAGEAPTAAMIGEFKGSQAGMDRTAESGVALAEAERGAENSNLNTLRKQALERLVRSKKIDTTGTNINNFLKGAMPFGQVEKGNQDRVTLEVGNMLNERAAAVGAKGYDTGTWGTWTAEGRNAELNAVQGRIVEKGGNPLEQTADEKRAMAEQTAVLKEIRDRLGKPGIPPPVGGGWPAPVIR